MINKQTQGELWKSIPNAIRHAIKEEYRIECRDNSHSRDYHNGYLHAFRVIFGYENILSDKEPEEVLAVPRKQVQEMYDFNEDILICDPTHKGAKLLKAKLQELFGSKCLPDEPNGVASNVASSEPKFKVGDRVRIKDGYYKEELHGCIGIIRKVDGCYIYVEIDSTIYPATINSIEPYNEPKEVARIKPIESRIKVYIATKEEDEEFRLLLHENGFKWNSGRSLISSSMWNSYTESIKIHFIHPDKTVTCGGDKTSDALTFSEFKKQYFAAEPEETSRTKESCGSDHSVVKSEMVDSIIKDSFRNERRLNIAVQILSGIVASSKSCKHPVKRVLELTDALIDECEKGGTDGN